jgi:DNA-binding beta-propeller fold protein YncE
MKHVGEVVPPTYCILHAFLVGASLVAGVTSVASAQPQAPELVFDPTWPKDLPNLWKLGGVTGLAVDKDDNVWLYNRPNDLTNIELHAELEPPLALCCVRAPSMIQLDRAGRVIGSFDAPQGHGMDVDSEGFVYLGQDTVRKYDPRTGRVVAEIARAAEREDGGPVGLQPAVRRPGQGGRGPLAAFLPQPPPEPATLEAQAARRAAFRAKYPPGTPLVVGQIEEIRIVEDDNEVYVADSYLGGRVLVFALDTLEFKRGWGAYGRPLQDISIDDADHRYTPNGAMPRDFVGHLTINVSRDGLVYAADRNANRIHVTSKQGEFMAEWVLAPSTGVGGSTGGIAFSPDREQRLLYVSDLTNNRIWFLNRADGRLVGELGRMGENGGQFFGLHMIAVDSAGNVYTGEVFQGERVQRFLPADSAKGRLLRQLPDTP